MQLSISTTFPQVARQLQQLRTEIASRALPRALNRTIEQAQTQMVRAIAREYTIGQREVRESLRIRRASAAQGRFSLTAVLESPSQKGRARNLIHFRARQVKSGVQVQILRGGPRKVIRGAFIANKQKSRYGGVVFQRRGPERLPIDALTTIGVPQMFNTKRINAAVVQTILSRFPEIFEREVRFYTERFDRKGPR